MKYFLIAFLAAVVIATASYGEINAKLGLAGGAARLAVEATKQIRPDINSAVDIGYGYNADYSLISAGAAICKPMLDMEVGLGISYSSYSAAVKNIVLAGDVSKSGVGIRVFARKPLRNALFAEVGYDTRLGAMAEAGLLIKN